MQPTDFSFLSVKTGTEGSLNQEEPADTSPCSIPVNLTSAELVAGADSIIFYLCSLIYRLPMLLDDLHIQT